MAISEPQQNYDACTRQAPRKIFERMSAKAVVTLSKSYYMPSSLRWLLMPVKFFFIRHNSFFSHGEQHEIYEVFDPAKPTMKINYE